MKQEVAEALQALKEAGSPLWAKLLAQHVAINGWMPIVVGVALLMLAAACVLTFVKHDWGDWGALVGALAGAFLVFGVLLILCGIATLLAPELTLLK